MNYESAKIAKRACDDVAAATGTIRDIWNSIKSTKSIDWFSFNYSNKMFKKTISKSQEFIKNTKNNGKHIVIKKKKKLICISFELFTIT